MGTTSYPGGLDDFAGTSPSAQNVDDSTGRTHSERHNDVEAAMEAVQAELGTDPAGGAATVKDRLEYAERFGSPATVYWPSGGYVTNQITTAANTTINLLNDKVYLVAWWCPTTATLDRVAVNVTTSQTSANARLGLYAANSDGGPGSLITDFGEVDCSSTGVKELTVSQSVTGGVLYHLAILNETVSVAYSGTANGGRPVRLESTSYLVPQGLLRYSQTYTSGLPSTVSSPDSNPGSNPVVFLLRRS